MKNYGKCEELTDGAKAKQPPVKSVLLQTYFTSLLGLVLCVTMFFGTSYAWFTSEVNNSGNEIYIGSLSVDLLKRVEDIDGDGISDYVSIVDPDSGAAAEKLFSGESVRWEPGYTAMEVIQIQNKGDLSSRYALTFTDGKIDGNTNDEELIKIAQHFVVYVHEGYFDPDNADLEPSSFADIKASAESENGTWRVVRMGKDPATLADILTKGFPVLSGNLEEQDEVDTYVIALHMLETAGEGETYEESIALSKELMGKRIGLNVKLTAYQRTHEADAFNKDYDLQAHVTNLGALNVYASTWLNMPTCEMLLDAAYQFQPVETFEEWDDSTYRNYTADFAIWSDSDIPADSVAVAGYYDLWCSANKDRWIYLQSPEEIKAGTEVNLVESLAGSPLVHYKDLCQYGNDGIGFLCGIKNLSAGNAGKIITVELRLYEPTEDGSKPDNYIVAGRYEYTLQAPSGEIVELP